METLTYTGTRGTVVPWFAGYMGCNRCGRPVHWIDGTIGDTHRCDAAPTELATFPAERVA